MLRRLVLVLFVATLAAGSTLAQQADLPNASALIPASPTIAPPSTPTFGTPELPPLKGPPTTPALSPLERAAGLVGSVGDAIGDAHGAATDVMLGVYHRIPEDVRPFVYAGFGTFGGVTTTLCEGPRDDARPCGEARG